MYCKQCSLCAILEGAVRLYPYCCNARQLISKIVPLYCKILVRTLIVSIQKQGFGTTNSVLWMEVNSPLFVM